MKKLHSLLQVLEASEKNGHTIVPIMDGILPVPLEKKSKEVRVVIADADGRGYIQDGMDSQESVSHELPWSKQALNALKTQYEAAQNHPLNQWLIQLFNIEKGIFAISNYCACDGVSNFVSPQKRNLNESDQIRGSYQDEKNTFLWLLGQQLLLNEINHKETDMEQLDRVLNLLSSGKLPAVALNPNADDTTLVHELTHAADNGISRSKLFRKICDIEVRHGGLLAAIDEQIRSAQTQGFYTNPDNYYQEILARTVQYKTSYDKTFGTGYFGKCHPLMNAYLEDIFYPLCMARVCGSEKAEEMSKSQELLHGVLLKESLGEKETAKLNSKEYMQTEFAQRLLEHMKRFHDTNIAQYIDEGLKLHHNTPHMQEPNLQLKKKQHKRKNTTLLERALELATPQGDNSSVDSVIQKASTEILRKYRHMSESEKL